MTRYVGTMTFDIEADDNDQAMTRARDLQAKITRASQKLGIGYVPGAIYVQAQPGPRRPMPEPCGDADHPEELFDA